MAPGAASVEVGELLVIGMTLIADVSCADDLWHQEQRVYKLEYCL